MNHKPRVVAILPAYNAKHTFKAVVDSLPKGVCTAIILSDDGSRDGTFEAAKKDKRLIIIKTPRNLGYGGNLKWCLSHALSLGADVMVEIHPDGEYKPDGILPALVKVQNGSHLVLGNRFLGSNKGMYAWKNVGTRLLSVIDRVVLQTQIGDLHQGFRVYTKELLDCIPYKSYSNNYLFSFEIIVDAIRNGLTVDEVPVSTSYTGHKRGALPKAAIIYALQTFLVLSNKTRKSEVGLQKDIRCPVCNTIHSTYPLYKFPGKHWIYGCFSCNCSITAPRLSSESALYPPSYYSGTMMRLKSLVYGWFQKRRVQWIKSSVPQRSLIIDVGAGNGAFAKQLGSSYNTISLEAPFADVRSQDVIRTNVLTYQPKVKADVVVFWQSLEHMDDPDQVLSHVNSWLRSGGKIYIECPAYDSIEARLFGRHWYHLDIPRHRTHFSKDGLQMLLSKLGFDTVECSQITAPEYSIPGFTASVFFQTPDQLLQGSHNPIKIVLYLLVLPISCLVQGILAILGQSPIMLIVAKKHI